MVSRTVAWSTVQMFLAAEGLALEIIILDLSDDGGLKSLENALMQPSNGSTGNFCIFFDKLGGSKSRRNRGQWC